MSSVWSILLCLTGCSISPHATFPVLAVADLFLVVYYVLYYVQNTNYQVYSKYMASQLFQQKVRSIRCEPKTTYLKR
jgi:hypothetical protein